MDLNFFKDVDDDSFWLTIWGMAGVFITIVVGIANYNLYLEDKMVADLIREGHDPIKIACAYRSSHADACTHVANGEYIEKVLKNALELQK